MVSDISEIKIIRKRLGLTQSYLAQISGVSQSLIAKIEAGTLDPKFSNAKKIFAALNQLKEKEDIKASQLMRRKIIKVSTKDDVIKAVKQMKNHGISQVPVIENNQLVGYISDSIIIDSLMKNKHMNIGEIMQDPPPVISKNASLGVITGLLRHYPFVMVSEKGMLNGIITKADVLGKI